MKLDRYELKADKQLSTFFFKRGAKRQNKKLIQFSPVNQNGVCNLALGDKNPVTGEIDDRAINDNNDSEKVLATMVSSLYAFCDQFPQAWVYATRSTAARTRLYRMGINKYYDVVEMDFEIFGQILSEWERYEFVVQRKKSYI